MNEPDAVLADRDIRQRDLVPPARLAEVHAIVIGVGSVGRQVALQLAAMGVPKLTLFDDDTVNPENLAVQGYWEGDLNMAKVDATGNVCHEQHPRLDLATVRERFRRSHVRSFRGDRRLAFFIAVDEIETRKLIWEAVRERASFYVDGRMTAEVIRVLASAAPQTDMTYARTLFSAREAYVGSCTSKSTIYSGAICAGLMLSSFARWLRNQPVTADLTLNLLAAELTVGE